MSHATFNRHKALLGSTFLFLLMAVQITYAQSGAGALRGAVNTSDGKAASNTLVTVRNSETGYVRDLHTDGEGRLDAPALPVGMYFVQATAGDAKTEEVAAVVTVGRTHDMELVLKTGPASAATVDGNQQTQSHAEPPS